MTTIKRTLPLALIALLLVAGSAMAADKKMAPGPINLNTATVEQLAELPHIGPKRAGLIVTRREQKPFKSVDELIEIKGIGDKTLEKIRPHVAVASPARR